jgi:predicted Mrr-cat superfamily restriction endonuclease
VDACVSNDVIALRFAAGDATSLDTEEIVANFADSDSANPQDHQRLAAELNTFANQIQIDDIVVSPDKPRNQYLVGRVTGKYEWNEETPVPNANHVRSIEWVNTISWDTVPVEFKTITNYQRAAMRVNDATLIAACVEALEDRKMKAELLSATPPVAKRPTSPRLRKTTAPAKAPKYDPTKQERLCKSCGLKKHIRQFSGTSEFCADCE